MSGALTRIQILGVPDATVRGAQIFKDRELVIQDDTKDLYIGDGSTAGGLLLGQATTAITGGANVGAGGVGPFKQLATGTLQFRNINSSTPAITVTLDGTNDEIDINLVPGSINISQLNNDSGFETGAQLDARDTANRSRANHTGSQLASTISDFATTVLNTVLTGISFATSTPVLAADSILVAIGKLQAQINALSVFGNEADDFTDNTQVSFSGATEVTVYTVSTGALVGGRYRFAVDVRVEPSSASSNDNFELRVDGNTVGLDIEQEGKDAGGDIKAPYQMVGYATLAAGTYNIELIGSNEAGGTTVVKGAVFEWWRQS